MTSFLANFRTFTSGSEVHPNHAIWSGLIALSTIIGKRAKLPMGYFDVYPNLYVVFVAPPGGRKSSARVFAQQMFHDVLGREQKPIDSITKEALVTVFHESTVSFTPTGGGQPIVYSPYTLMVDEMSELVGPSKESMVSFLTAVYDKVGDFGVRTVKRKDEVITNPYMVLLGCTTPAWITQRLKDDIISGGFTRRVIFVYEPDEPRRVAFPEITDEMRAAWDSAVAYGKRLLTVSGTFEWEASAKAAYTHWYNTRTYPSDPNTLYYHRNKHMQVLKVAQLISLSREPDLRVTLNDLEFTFSLFEHVEQTLPQVFEGVGRNELKGISSLAIELVRANGGIFPQKQIITQMFAHGTEQEINQVLNYLVQSNRLVYRQVTTGASTIQMICTPEGAAQLEREIEFRKKSAFKPPDLPKPPI